MDQARDESTDLLARLSAASSEERTQAIADLSTLTFVTKPILERIEWMVVNDPDTGLRPLAAQALDLPAARQARRQRVAGSSEYLLKTITGQIDQWQLRALITSDLASLLKSIYVVPSGSSSAAPAQPQPPAAKVSLTQALFSETSIRTFLYLGAFFVVAASLILAALVEELRLPVLTSLLIVFGSAALVIRKRLPQPSSVLFMVSVALIPITANVLLERLHLAAPGENFYHTAAFAVFALACLAGTWLYSSSLFSLIALAGSLISAYYLSALVLTLVPNLDLSYLLLTLANLAGIGLAAVLRTWKKNQKFHQLLFWSAQVIQLGLLTNNLVFALGLYYTFGFQTSPRLLDWTVVGAAMLAAGLFYLTSYLVEPSKRFFPALAVLGSCAAPFFIAQAFEPNAAGQITVLLVSGGFCVLFSELFHRLRRINLPGLSTGFLIGAAGLLGLGTLFGWVDQVNHNDSLLLVVAGLVSGICLAVAQIVRPRWYVWSGALASLLIAYLATNLLPAVLKLEIPSVVVWLIPCFVFLLPDILLARAPGGIAPGWRYPLLSIGALACLVLVSLVLAGVGSEIQEIIAAIALSALLLVYAWRRHANVAFAGFAVVVLLLASKTASLLLCATGFVFALLFIPLVWKRKVYIGYLATALWAVSLMTAVKLTSFAYVSIALALLAAVYFAAGALFRSFKPASDWVRGSIRVLEFSGLALSTYASFAALIEHSTIPVQAFIPATLAALLWTGEAFLRRNVYLGFPANALYLMSFCTLIFSLNVKEPQAYSIAAAAVGFLQYHLLIRAGKLQISAFITGGVAMLVLLGTTYIQMIAAQELKFFALLFFQSLIVMTYGILIRSRSLFGFPILASVVGVITVVLFILQGLSTVIIIGGTGILMIAVGIAAVLMRERIAKIGSKLSEWKA